MMTRAVPAPVDDRAELIDIVSRLVAAPSQNPGEDERLVAGLVEELCRELGLPRPRRVGVAERPNLIVELDFGPGGHTLGLCGHLDTKPVGEGRWSTDPLQAAHVNGELRGRGVVDMKGAIGAMLLAAADLAAEPPARGRLLLVLPADEENGAVYGGQWLAEHEPIDADAIVIGEPGGLFADWDRLHLGSRGICNFDLDIVTEQGHSSLRDAFELTSATEVAAALILALRSTFVPPVPSGQPWMPTMNPGVVIEGGINYGVLPGRARVASECRLVPGMERAAFEAALRDFLDQQLPATAHAELTIRNWIPATVIDAAHPLAAAARDALDTVVGEVPADDVFPGTTDATWFAAMGIPCLPALGPGLLQHAHATDERVTIASLQQARRLYRTLARRFCEQPT
jgi:acetylornithine deacetylase/succinyl-diaminopimelate desuccinylase-like protein